MFSRGFRPSFPPGAPGGLCPGTLAFEARPAAGAGDSPGPTGPARRRHAAAGQAAQPARARRSPAAGQRRNSNAPPAAAVATSVTPIQPQCASARLPSAPPAAIPMKTLTISTALRRLRAAGSMP